MIFLPILNTLLSISLLELFIVLPKQFYWLILGIILLNIVSSYIITPINRRSIFWRLAIMPSLLSLSIGAYISLLRNDAYGLLINFFIVVLGIILFLYWRYHYLYFYKNERYQSLSIENLSFWVNFLTSFFIAASAYGFIIVLGLTWWKVVLLIACVLGLLLYQNFWVCDFHFKDVWPDLLIAFIALLQLFYSISWLPLHYNSLGLTWAIGYYVVVGLIYSKLSHKLTKDKVKLYVGLAVVSWIIVALSSRWI